MGLMGEGGARKKGKGLRTKKPSLFAYFEEKQTT